MESVLVSSLAVFGQTEAKPKLKKEQESFKASPDVSLNNSIGDSSNIGPVDDIVLESAINSGILTMAMIEEEEKLIVLSHEEDKDLTRNDPVTTLPDMTLESRYAQLQALLNRSKFYTQYLVNKIDSAKNDPKKVKSKAQVKKEKKLMTFTNASIKKSERMNKSVTPETKPSHRHVYPVNFEKRRLVVALTDCLKAPPPKKVKLDENLAIDKDYEQPKYLTGSLRDYQKDGYKWMKVLYENGVNGILGDEMGLGKTIQCIALICHLVEMGVEGPFLICAPLSTLPNWIVEFEKFAPQIPVILYHGSKPDRVAMSNTCKRLVKVDDVKAYPVIVTSYEIAIRDVTEFRKRVWKYVIIDEGHRIKNTNCLLLKRLKELHSYNRLLLTGTPLQNNLSELWSLLNFIMPEIFDDLLIFQSWFDATMLNDNGTAEQIVAQEREKSVLNTLHERMLEEAGEVIIQNFGEIGRLQSRVGDIFLVTGVFGVTAQYLHMLSCTYIWYSLEQILAPFLLRRIKADVDLNIPPKRELHMYASLTSSQYTLYKSLFNGTIKAIMSRNDKNFDNPPAVEKGKTRSESRSLSNRSKSDHKNKSASVAKYNQDDEFDGPKLLGGSTNSELNVRLSSVFMQMRKCCYHPYLLEYPIDPFTEQYRVDEEIVTSSGKMMLLDALLTQLKQEGHKVLIFSQFVKMLNILEDYCYLRNYPFSRLDGSRNLENRRENIATFNDDAETFVFLISTRAGGLGINLTAADTVIIFDSDWNPQCDLQAMDRCHRIGQTKPVVVYRLITENTIDQRIVERASCKRKLEKMVIQKGRFKSANNKSMLNSLNPDELLDLLKSSDHDGTINASGRHVFSPEELNVIFNRDFCAKKAVSDQALRIKVIAEDNGQQ